MNCYGKSFDKLEVCSKCKLHHWCATAADPALIGNFMTAYDEGRGKNYTASLEHPAMAEREERSYRKRRFFTRSEMIQVIKSLLKMDLATIDILYEKLKEPGLKITRLGRKKHIPRQRVYSHLHKAFSIIPSLRDAVNVNYGFNVNAT